MPTSPTTSTETSPSVTPSTIRIGASSRTDQKIDITATVLSADGHYVANVPLSFSVDAGTISPNTAVTDGNGSARALASTPSATTLHVSGAGLSTQASLPASQAASTAESVILNVPGAGTTGVPVTMFVSSASGGPWSWSFGDGASAQTSTLSTTHTYGHSGGYSVSVSGPNAASSSANITITDPPSAPGSPAQSVTGTLQCTAAAHGSPTGCHITLTDVDGSSLTANVDRVTWDWGDGAVDTTPTPGSTSAAVALHSYTVAGSYTVRVNIHATGGQTATAQASITVS